MFLHWLPERVVRVTELLGCLFAQFKLRWSSKNAVLIMFFPVEDPVMYC